MKNLVISLSYMLAFVALPVLAANFLTIFHKIRKREYDEVFEFAIALVIGWFPPLVLRILFILGDYGFMNAERIAENGPIVPVMVAMTIVSGILHVRVLTRRTYPRLWIYSAVSGVLLFAASMIFLRCMV